MIAKGIVFLMRVGFLDGNAMAEAEELNWNFMHVDFLCKLERRSRRFAILTIDPFFSSILREGEPLP
jgi:hypothetical protein